ncbi:MAG TPA: 4Fe-4S binding protein [Verrucomicrobiae bacterium]|nr:4Fe-4S binding protein [Verrucomicrobiae bacterium]
MIITKEQCLLCGICTDSCPIGAIRFDGTYFIDQEDCTGCRICVTACPLGAIQAQPKQTP